MSTHTIMLPSWDPDAQGDLRALVWDDEAGTVEGDYSHVDSIRAFFEDPKRWTAGTVKGKLRLEDPRHRPEDFAGMIMMLYCSAGDWERIVWPSALADVVPTSPDLRLPPGAIG